jgi:glyceraldehyde 3-phosphate dehydrogenase
MTTRIGINGFGRIGRQVTRSILERHADELEIVAVNDLTDTETNAHLFKYDTNYGRYPGTVEASDGHVVVDGKPIKVLSERDPAKIPWADLGVQLVIESTGFFTNAQQAAGHLEGGAKKVIISAPGGADVDATIVYGVNHQSLSSSHTVISNASCTTNCLAPLAKAIHDRIGIERGLMTTIHAFTNDQVLSDVYHSDLRRARSATQSMIPTGTGAAKAVGLVLPELDGKLDGFAIRVPTINVSVVDLTFTASRDTSRDEIDAAVKAASEQELKGVLAYCDEPLVSIDFNHDPASSTYDSKLTRVIDGRLVKVVAWYDNEWGYSSRCVDLVKLIAERAAQGSAS